MNAPNVSPDSSEARLSALFQTLVAQQVNMAAICLGQAPDEKGQTTRDLEGARFFIDVLEMLEARTKGNVSKNEDQLLKQSLTSLRLAYVEVANAAKTKSPDAPAPPPPSSSPQPAPQAPADAESRKKFTKKY